MKIKIVQRILKIRSTNIFALVLMGAASAQGAEPVQVFYDDFQPASITRSGQWETANWALGAPFGCRWSPDNVGNAGKGLALNVDGASGKCAEIRTWKYWQYGSFTVNMKPASLPGMVSSFFLFDQKTDAASRVQISLDFIGGTNKVRTVYWAGNQQNAMDIDLGRFNINAGSKLRNYTIQWTPTSIAWYVNNDAGQWVELRRVAAAVTAPMRLMLSAWYGNNQGEALNFPGMFYGGNVSAEVASVWIGKTADATDTSGTSSNTSTVAPVSTSVSATTTSTTSTHTSSAITSSTSTGATTAAVTTAVTGYPFANQRMYTDPSSQAAQFVNTGASGFPLDVMKKISTQPASLWLGSWNSNVYADVQGYATRARSSSSMPIFTLYNIPSRDCGSYSAGGTSAAAYPTWVQQVAMGIGDTKAAVIVEPDALSQINQSGCLSDAQKGERYQLIKNAITTLRRYAPNTAIYLDAGNPQWIPAGTMAQHLNNAGVAQADGFALNVSNFFSTESNVSYGTQISSQVGGKHFVIDTSRNGRGPTADYQWCNPTGRGLGLAPRGFTSGLVDAYLWVKRPGESDGSCNGGPNAGAFWPQGAYDLATRAQ